MDRVYVNFGRKNGQKENRVKKDPTDRHFEERNRRKMVTKSQKPE
jgi:hypothetical protein